MRYDKRDLLIITITVLIVVAIVALAIASEAQGQAANNLFLPIVNRNVAPVHYRPLPTPAPTECPGWEDGVCDPTPTPFMICFPDGCPTETPVP